ncbi:PREDICTED: uncharacterized protein LOC109228125 [Nicotiana attenuata]|uniref:uncharacterized protein LOC109221463 n=1 Tax=Nicotiana attenuata TaxID=49451 RepID=UPI000904E670|nr:PREDICTED: uncharacterized protein LOC109221463 [Nicotiana attenuata]XP_019248848.1 PREDICTED: uncharacterized protein LOC109228125 [Nicotiana attenuata]
MASVVGKPLYTDKFTAHYEKISYAMVLVEVDAAYPLPDQLEIELPFGPMVQTIEYDWKPVFCNDCLKFGHDSIGCWHNTKCDEELDTKEGERPRRQRRRGKKQVKAVKQAWVVKKPEVNAESEPQKEANAGTSTQENICRNPMNEGNIDKGKEIAEIRHAGRRGQQIDPDVMGCIETRVKEHKAEKIQKKIAQRWNVCYNYSYAVNGRIWILWRSHIQVQNDGHQRESLWRDLRQINAQAQETWLLSGDFNNILSSEDRIGSPITTIETQGFKDVIDALQLTPLRAKGWHYTWTNKQGTGSRVYSKIDWALGNYWWIQQYGHVEADFMNPLVSDHSPILIKCGKQKLLHPKPFRLYTNVMELPQFQSILQQVWIQNYDGTPVQPIWCKLKTMKTLLKDTNAYMASYKQKLEQAREKLVIVQNQIQQNPLAHGLFDLEKDTFADIEKWSNVEEQVMRQKSKASWIECGDANTKYFHAQWKIRSSQNSITSIYTDTGVKITDPKLVEQEFISVFQSLMGDCATEIPCTNTTVIKEGPCLTTSQQRSLIQDVTNEEITNAVWEMPKDNAPRVDGFPVGFFTRNWETVKKDIFAVVNFFFY